MASEQPERRQYHDRRKQDIPYRAWVLLAIGYFVLFLGGLTTLVWVGHQRSDLRTLARGAQQNAQRLNDATAGLCSAILQVGPENERNVIVALGRGELVPLPAECRELLRHIRG